MPAPCGAGKAAGSVIRAPHSFARHNQPRRRICAALRKYQTQYGRKPALQTPVFLPHISPGLEKPLCRSTLVPQPSLRWKCRLCGADRTSAAPAEQKNTLSKGRRPFRHCPVQAAVRGRSQPQRGTIQGQDAMLAAMAGMYSERTCRCRLSIAQRPCCACRSMV